MKRKHLLIELAAAAVAVVAGAIFLPRGLFRRVELPTHVVEASVVEASVTVGGSPVACRVELRGRRAVLADLLESDVEPGRLLATADAGADGRVTFADVRDVSLSLRTTLPDGRVVETGLDPPRGAPRRVAFDVPSIGAGSAIELRVTGLEALAPGDRLSLWWDRDEHDEIAPILIEATREGDGRATVPRLPAGQAGVQWDRPGRFSMRGGRAPLAADAASVELAIGRRDAIRGDVATTAGAVGAGVVVSVSTSGGHAFAAHANVGVRGEFALDALAPAGPTPIIVTTLAPGFVPSFALLPRDAPAPTTPCRPRLSRAATIRARVRTEDGRPVEGVEVRLATSGGYPVGTLVPLGASVRTASDGTIRIEDVPPDTYGVRVTGPDWVSPAPGSGLRRGTTVTLVGGAEADVELVAVPARVVRGTVRDRSGRPIAGAIATAMDRPGTRTGHGMLGSDVVESDLDGTFRWRRLPEDVDLWIRVERAGFSRFSMNLADGVEVVEVTLDAPTRRATATPSPRASSVAAPSKYRTVAVVWKDRDGRPVEGVEATAWVPGSADAEPAVAPETSEADGRFFFDTDPGDVYDFVGVLRTRPEPVVGIARVVAGAIDDPPAPAIEVVLGPPDPARVHLIVIDGVDGAPNRGFPRNGLTIEGGVKTDFEIRNGVIALPTERLRGATLVVTAANDEWGYPQDIMPERVPIDVSTGVTRVRLRPGPVAPT